MKKNGIPMDWCYLNKDYLENDIGFDKCQSVKFINKYNHWLQRKNQLKQNKISPMYDSNSDIYSNGNDTTCVV